MPQAALLCEQRQAHVYFITPSKHCQGFSLFFTKKVAQLDAPQA